MRTMKPTSTEQTSAKGPRPFPAHAPVELPESRRYRLKKRLLFIANALKQHPVGLEEVADGIWSIHFCRVLLGRVDERDCIIRA